jgi:hypothetical protein
MLKLNAGSFNSTLGLSMGEIASLSRSQHKSQGFGVNKHRGEIIEYFTYLAGDSAQLNLFEHLPDYWNTDKSALDFQAKITAIVRDFDAQFPHKSLPALLELAAQLKKREQTPFYANKLLLINDILYSMSGLFIDFTAPVFECLPGDSISTTFASFGGAPNSTIFTGTSSWMRKFCPRSLVGRTLSSLSVSLVRGPRTPSRLSRLPLRCALGLLPFMTSPSLEVQLATDS